MNIIIDGDTAIYTFDKQDGIFRCQHEGIHIDPPCCDGTDCGCSGELSLYCPDCGNKDLTISDIERLCQL